MLKSEIKKKELELGRGSSLPERSEMPAEYKWKLEDIYGTDEAWEKSFSDIKSRLPELAAYKGALAQSPEKMLEFFRLRDELSIELGKRLRARRRIFRRRELRNAGNNCDAGRKTERIHRIAVPRRI